MQCYLVSEFDPARMERRLSSVSLYEPSEDEEIEQFIEEYRRSQQASREAGHGLYHLLLSSVTT